MFQNYFKTAWRNLIGNRAYSSLNILGLGTGMAVALLIGLWVDYQFSYDRFLPDYQHIYQAKMKFNNNGEMVTLAATPLPLAAAMKSDVPGIKYVAQSDWSGWHGLVVGEKRVYLSGLSATDDYLNIFRLPMIKGSGDAALKDPYSIVLNESTAKALFAGADPMNRMVRFDNSHDLKVTGIIKDIPANSTVQFNYIVPLSYMVETVDWVKDAQTNWNNKSFQNFFSLQANASPAAVATQLKTLIKKYFPPDYKSFKAEVRMVPYKDSHLYVNGAGTGGFIDYVKMFSLIGLLVLIIACINFINLSTARSEKRAREVGVRKAIGSQRIDLIFQFLIESLTITFIAFFISLLLVQLVLPSFNMLTSTKITIPYTNGWFWLIMVGYVMVTGLIAGSRPAFYLSSFQPVKVLKGPVRIGRGGSLPRKILVVTQFSCSIALIISTIIVYRQIEHAKSRPTGYDANRLVTTDASSDLNRNYDALKNEMLRTGVVTGVTKSSSPVTAIYANNSVSDWQGKLPGETLGISVIGVSDADYFKTIGMQLKEGRNFIGNFKSDSLSVILNEAAVKRMRYKNPINQVITWHDNPQRATVIGVVKDALMTSPFAPAEPSIFVFDPNWASVITYRISPTVSSQTAIAKLAPIFSRFNPAFPYLYNFVDDEYASKFDFEILIGKLAGWFAGLAIFISSLGLFGLAAYLAEQRNKEIGIRKVLGASVSQVWLLLSKEFIVLVVISCAIASPVAFYFLHYWLQKYDYRITIGPGVFIIAAVGAIVLTIVTISFQAIKAALSNPVKSLKTD